MARRTFRDANLPASEDLMRRFTTQLAIVVLGCAALPALASAQNAMTTTDLNLRAGPSTDFPVVDVIPGNAEVTVHGCIEDFNWCDTSFDGIRGWAYGSYLQTMYQQSYVPLVEYGPRVGLPIIGFSIDRYWGSYYRDRSWYHRRDRWRHAWRGGDRRPDRNWREERRGERTDRRRDRRDARAVEQRQERVERRRELRDERRVNRDRRELRQERRANRAERRANRPDRNIRTERRANRAEQRRGNRVERRQARPQQSMRGGRSGGEARSMGRGGGERGGRGRGGGERRGGGRN